MAGLCEGGNEPSGSLKAICKLLQYDYFACLVVQPTPPCREHSLALTIKEYKGFKSGDRTGHPTGPCSAMQRS
ncbi:hypothetical protein ANN_09331 [Periplaneta americana]|uniref:Uncharacterized protein n=1 Tax=Periplaneta americana TaxID=6978 RepID=A0ABQ8TLF7_PERAM|nr:hypothetical protein ANN_09331 [Periplaneta americana]